jgi:hypothetical protein
VLLWLFGMQRTARGWSWQAANLYAAIPACVKYVDPVVAIPSRPLACFLSAAKRSHEEAEAGILQEGDDILLVMRSPTVPLYVIGMAARFVWLAPYKAVPVQLSGVAPAMRIDGKLGRPGTQSRNGVRPLVSGLSTPLAVFGSCADAILKRSNAL